MTFADIVTIGDSQTFGNNASLENNWPSRLRSELADKRPVLYSMAAGGWGAVRYLDIFMNATVLQPRVVVAFSTGNDPLDSFQVADVKVVFTAIPTKELVYPLPPATESSPMRCSPW